LRVLGYRDRILGPPGGPIVQVRRADPTIEIRVVHPYDTIET
jgi:hypothetical protein